MIFFQNCPKWNQITCIRKPNRSPFFLNQLVQIDWSLSQNWTDPINTVPLMRSKLWLRIQELVASTIWLSNKWVFTKDIYCRSSDGPSDRIKQLVEVLASVLEPTRTLWAYRQQGWEDEDYWWMKCHVRQLHNIYIYIFWGGGWWMVGILAKSKFKTMGPSFSLHLHLRPHILSTHLIIAQNTKDIASDILLFFKANLISYEKVRILLQQFWQLAL